MSKSKGRKLSEWLRGLDANSKASSDSIKAGSITTAKLDDGAVTTAKLDDLGVTFGKLHTALVVTESGGIGNNDNDATVATSAAIVDYVSANTGIALTDLSVGTPNSASGSGAISYSNSTGVFNYTPPDLSSYLTSVPAQSFASLTGKPTTISGYGITDAFDGAYSSLTGTPTIPTNNNQLTNGAGYITGYTVTESDVTGHQAALSITESQISDLGSYLTGITSSQVTTALGYTPAEGTMLISKNTGTPDTAGDNYGLNAHYMTSAATNKPTGTDHSLLTLSYSNAWQTQLAGDWRTNKWYVREQNNGTWGGWDQILTTADEGSGNGIDADTVDGIQGSSIMRLDASGTVPDGVIHTYECYGNIAVSSGNQASLQCFNSGSGTDAFMTFHVGGDYAANLGVDGGINDLAYGGWSAGANSYRVYHAGNTPSQTITVAGIGRNAHHTGHLVGSYNSVGANSYKSNPIYTIGSSYNPTDAALSNMYGIGYTHTNASFITGFGGGWGMYVAADGDARIYFGASSGHIYGTGNITSYASDGRLKTNVTPIENAIDKVKKIRGVTFDWVDNITSEYDFHPGSMHETGVIAQEIQEVIPDAVVTAPFNGNYTRKSGTDHNFLTVDKDKIVPLLIEAIKEQQEQIEELKEMIGGTSK